MNNGSIGWLESFATKVASFFSNQIGSESSVTRRAINAYTTVIKRLLVVVSVSVMLWLVAIAARLAITTALMTIALATFTFALLVVVWPVGFLILGARYKELVAKVLVAELGAGLLAYVFHIKATALPPLFLASSYLAVSSTIGPAKGFRRAVNWVATLLIVFVVAAPIFPKTTSAIGGLAPKIDNVGATVLSGAAGKSFFKTTDSHSLTITLPADGSASVIFDPNQHVPPGWWYVIDAPTGTMAHWSNGTIAPAQQRGHPGQAFSLSLQGGGTAQVVWQPTPFQDTANHTTTIDLPSDGSLSATFDVQANVPVGWWYQIDAPVGTQAHWSGGTTTSYKDIAQHAGQSFSLSVQGGGIATVEWQPHPPATGGQ